MSKEFSSDASTCQSGLTLREFYEQKLPATYEERMLVIAYYLEKFRRESHFDYHRINECFDELSLPRSSNAATLLSHAKDKKLLREVRERRAQPYRLTTLGEQEVESMPRTKKSKPPKSPGPNPNVQVFIRFKGDTSLVDVHECVDIQDRALWILAVAREYLNIEGLDATAISNILQIKYGIKDGRRQIADRLREHSQWATKKGRTYVISEAGLEHVHKRYKK